MGRNKAGYVRMFREYEEYLHALGAAMQRQYPKLDSQLIQSACTQGFLQAKREWDGKRQFRPLLRRTIINLVIDELRRKMAYDRLHRPILEDEEGNSELDVVADVRTWENPARGCELADLRERLTTMGLGVLCTLIDAPEQLGIRGTDSLHQIQGKLRRYLQKQGWGLRSIWAIKYRLVRSGIIS